MIGKARVPIIKFIEKKSGVAFDIRFFCLPFVLELNFQIASYLGWLLNCGLILVLIVNKVF